MITTLLAGGLLFQAGRVLAAGAELIYWRNKNND